MEDKIQLNIVPKKILLVLTGIMGLIIFFHLTRNCYSFPNIGITERLDMDVEKSIPTWYSVCLLFLTAIILLAIGILKKQMEDKHTFKWMFLSFVFLFMSLDESAMIHEMVGLLVGRMTKITSGYLAWGWYIPAMILVVFILLYLMKFWLSLPKRIKFLFLLSAVIFVGGSVGAEMISANYISTYAGGDNPYTTFLYIALVAIEEGAEMLGVIVFIYSLLLYLNETNSKIGILIKDKS